MFTLWYTILSWKEYRDVIAGKLTKKKSSNKISVGDAKLDASNKSGAVKSPSPVPPKKEDSRIPVIEPSKQSKSPSPQPKNSTTPTKPPSISPAPLPKSASLQPQAPKPTSQSQKASSPSSPLKKPVRLPSPHPIRNEDYEEESDEEDSDAEEDEDEEDDDEDEDSLVEPEPIKPKVPWTEDSRKTTPSRNSVNDFINQEKRNQKNNIGYLPR